MPKRKHSQITSVDFGEYQYFEFFDKEQNDKEFEKPYPQTVKLVYSKGKIKTEFYLDLDLKSPNFIRRKLCTDYVGEIATKTVKIVISKNQRLEHLNKELNSSLTAYSLKQNGTKLPDFAFTNITAKEVSDHILSQQKTSASAETSQNHSLSAEDLSPKPKKLKKRELAVTTTTTTTTTVSKQKDFETSSSEAITANTTAISKNLETLVPFASAITFSQKDEVELLELELKVQNARVAELGAIARAAELQLQLRFAQLQNPQATDLTPVQQGINQ